MVFRIFIDDRAVPGKFKLRLYRRISFDRDSLGDDSHLSPAGRITVAARIIRVGLIDVQVFLIDWKNGQAPGTVIVMPYGNAGEGRLAAADDVPAWRRQMHPVAERRYLERAVGIVGQKGQATPGEPAADRPIVAPLGWLRDGLK